MRAPDVVHTAQYVEASDILHASNDGTHGTYSFGPQGKWGNLSFQNGPVAEVGGRNGAFLEEVLEGVVLHRLRELNEKFPCRENSLAITNIEQGLLWLNRRTELRRRQGVEGKNEEHVS